MNITFSTMTSSSSSYAFALLPFGSFYTTLAQRVRNRYILSQLLNACNYDPPTEVDHILTPAEHAGCSGSWDHYKYGEYFFTGLAGFGMIIGIWLNYDDKNKRGSQLNRVHNKETTLGDGRDTIQ
jgi:hypothetical protein